MSLPEVMHFRWQWPGPLRIGMSVTFSKWQNLGTVSCWWAQRVMMMRHMECCPVLWSLTCTCDFDFDVFYKIHPSSKDAIGGSYLSSQQYLFENHTEEIDHWDWGSYFESNWEIGCRLMLSLQTLHLGKRPGQFGWCYKFRTTNEVDLISSLLNNSLFCTKVVTIASKGAYVSVEF